ncbi:aspartate--ammonia ligase [Lachnoclostridium sp. Marseille-P6806]|uniref:aspartate--ammonia ligase n=1 Tax=Lachnoclostridium sp. Marseille-P6806 TaxID=2364793 RepID=UPI0010312A78|nr:aspartate--ammonia ligase [Lachnoclostridium sp. Marseille-P6806]
METLIIPRGYTSALDQHETQVAIKTVKDCFQDLLSERLNLLRVSAPLFVAPETGLNDNLNGVERPVSFDIRDQENQTAEVVQSLAKWKRYALKRYGFHRGEGLYTDMSAIRRDEITDNIHSIYVDQWDWEKIIDRDERTLDTLKSTVRDIYAVLRKTEKYMSICYDYIEELLPKDIFFVTAEELAEMFPDNTPKEREYYITKAKGAVCIMKIGDDLADGKPHDGRAPDYDDWSLNADILVYYPVLDIALELSSMGIRVDEASLAYQLKKAGCEERAELPFQKAILSGELPYSIGGGIGQSRICMFFLRKAHIGEVQCSLWPKDVAERAEEHGIDLL